MSSTRDLLRRKRRRTVTYRFEVEDSAAAEREVEQAITARFRLRLAYGEDSPEVQAAAEREEAARAAYRNCFAEVVFQQIPAADLERLQQERAEADAAWAREHADDDPKPERPDWPTDPDSFEVRLIAASAVDSDLTPEEWVAELADERWSAMDRLALMGAALQANSRREFDVGKG